MPCRCGKNKRIQHEEAVHEMNSNLANAQLSGMPSNNVIKFPTLTYTPQRMEEARDRASMAAMIDIGSFLLALDDIEHLLQHINSSEQVQ